MFARQAFAVVVSCALVVGCGDEYAGIVIYVDADATGAGDGTSWADAFTDLQSGLDASRGGDELWVAEGTYVPTREQETGSPRTKTFALVRSVSVYGGFSGVEDALGQRDWTTNVTILSGDLNGDDVGFTNNVENCFHVLLGAKWARLDGFTVTGGRAEGLEPYRWGPGILVAPYDCTGVKIANCTFTYNSAQQGGAVFSDYAGATVMDCTFVSNTGAISAAGSMTVTGCTFQGNSGNAVAALDGSSMTVTGCTFDGNSGSGIDAFGLSGTVNVSDCTFTANARGIDNYLSGTISDCSFSDNTSCGIRLETTAAATIRRCTFTNNVDGITSWSSGGLNATATIAGCTFVGHTSSGVELSGVMGSIVNCVFRQNSASTGGGLCNGGLVDCVNCTFSGNSATTGGAVYNSSNATLTLKNCILWGNSASTGPEIYNAGTLTVTYCDVEGGWSGTGNVGGQPSDDPLFADAALRLSASSPCIDAGTGQGAPRDDVEGNPRPGAGTAGYDMGAFEWQAP